MDFLTAYVTLATSFMENLVKLGWPVAVVGVAWFFRDVIKVKLTSLQGVDGYGVKINFREEIAAVSERAHYVAEPSATFKILAKPILDPKRPESGPQDGLGIVLNGAQLLMVSHYFSQLTSELRRVAGRHGYTKWGQKRFVESMLKSLLDKRVIGLDLAKQISELRKLRDLAQHNPEDITEEELTRYFELVAGAILELRKIAPRSDL